MADEEAEWAALSAGIAALAAPAPGPDRVPARLRIPPAEILAWAAARRLESLVLVARTPDGRHLIASSDGTVPAIAGTIAQAFAEHGIGLAFDGDGAIRPPSAPVRI